MTGTERRRKSGMADNQELREQARAAHHPASIKLLKLLVLLLGALLLWGILSWLISAIPLRKVEVTGLTRYSEEDVLVMSGLNDADRMFGVDKERVATSLTTFYPYIKSVRLRYAFPLGYRLEITEEIPAYYTCIAGDYFTLSKELKVLERATREDRFAAEGLQKITLGDIQSAMLGETILYDGDYLDLVLRSIHESVLSDRVDEIHIGDRYHLSIVCDEIFTLQLGTIDSIDAKLRLALLMIQQTEVPQGYRATLDVSDLKKTSIRYDGIQDEALSASE